MYYDLAFEYQQLTPLSPPLINHPLTLPHRLISPLLLGVYYDLALEYQQLTGAANVVLQYSSASIRKQVDYMTIASHITTTTMPPPIPSYLPFLSHSIYLPTYLHLTLSFLHFFLPIHR